jgi:hypothetical protein
MKRGCAAILRTRIKPIDVTTKQAGIEPDVFLKKK